MATLAASPVIFNRSRLRQHRDRAASRIAAHDFLLRQMCERLADRLPDITRSFPMALDLGAHHGLLAEYLPPQAGIETLVQADVSEAMIFSSPFRGEAGRGAQQQRLSPISPPPNLPPKGGGILKLVADEEYLPFAPASFDLVLSVGSLHWVNDVPGTLAQIHRILKPGGLFLASLPGGETLRELRQSFERAELAISGGISPRISPFIDVKDAGSLLQRAGFTLPVTDSDTLTLSYEHPLKLLQDLRGMGETNALLASTRHFTTRSLLFAALEDYRKHFSTPEGRVTATIDLITLTGWKNDAHTIS